MTATTTGTRLVLPRVGTPRNYGRETLGHEVAEVARRLGKPLLPWQRHAADVALELDPATGELWYEEIDLTVPRQCGKTTLIFAEKVWRSITMARRLGTPQTSTYVAQHGTAARKKLQREFLPLLRRSKYLHEVPHARATPQKVSEWKPSMNNGSEHIYWGTGSWLQVAPPTETASHGDVLDDATVDEAFAHSLAAGGLVEQALDAATITRRSPQLWVVSTAGNGRSEYLWRKVRAGRRACERGEESRVCYLEWSLPEEGVDWFDPEVWVEYHPALGHTQTVARLMSRLEKARRFDAGLEDIPAKSDDDDEEAEYGYGVDGWLRGYMNVWREIPGVKVAEAPSKMDPAHWQATGLPHEAAKAITEALKPGMMTMAFAVHDGMASVAIATGTLGDAYVESVADRPGTSWLAEWFVNRVEKYKPRAVGWSGANGQASAVATEILERRAAEGLPVDMFKPVTYGDYQSMCEGFHQNVEAGRLRRPELSTDPLLAAGAVATAQTYGADKWVWDLRASKVPLSPLVAATVARGLLTEQGAQVPEFFVY